MNINMIRPKIEAEVLFFFHLLKTETPIEQTHTKAQETLEFKFNKARETFHFNTSIQINGDWMIGLTSLEIYNSIFNIREENNNLELYNFPDEKSGGISYEKVRDEFGKDLGISDITPTDLQNDIIGPIIIKAYREQVTKRMEDEKYMDILGF